MDALGIDVLLTGSQKALALPPGFSLFTVSEKAFARAAKQKDRGYYFDFLEFKKQQAEGMTPTTPSIGHVFALQSKLDEIFAEGLDESLCATRQHQRARPRLGASARLRFFRRRGLPLHHAHLREKQSRIDVAEAREDLREKHHLVIDGGYGKLKGQTFRLSNMGDETEETVSHLLALPQTNVC